jgi:hypothetical protein
MVLERVYLKDGDCEASGTTYWTAANNATLTKDATTPQAGTQCLKIAYNGNNYPCAQQTTLVNGQVYRLRCYLAGDGTHSAYITDGVTVIAVATASAAWQQVDAYFKAGSTTLQFVSNTVGGPSGFARVDSVQLEPAFINDGDMELAPPTVTLVNSDFSAWTGAPWTEVPTGWTVSSPGTAANHVAQDPVGSIRIVSDGTYVGVSQNVCVVGNVYTYEIVCSACSVGSVALAGTGTYQAISAPGTYTGTFIADAVALNLKRNAACDATIDRITITNISATAYTAWQAIVSKQTGTPYGGTRCLRVAYDGTNETGSAKQVTLTVGQVYRVRGYARSDGAAVPKVGTDATYFWTGVAGAAWTAFDFTFRADNATLHLYGTSLAAGRYVEFDSITIENVSSSGALDLSGHGRHANQATLTKQYGVIQNAINGKPAARSDGVDDILKARFPLAQPYTLLVVAKWTKQADARYLVDGDATNSGGVYHGAVNTAILAYAGAGGVTGPNFTDAQPGIIAVTFNGASTSVSYNGGAPVVGNAGTVSPNGVTLFAVGGDTGFYAVSDLAEFALWDHVLDAETLRRAVAYEKREWGIAA